METRDRIAAAALGMSVLALIVAISSAVFSGKQYWLNEARDQREREARLPTFDHSVTKKRDQQLWKLTTDILNRNDVKLVFDFLAIETPEGARLARAEGSVGLGAVPAADFVPAGIAPNGSATWAGYIVIDDRFPGGRGKPASLVYAFRFLDAPDTQIEKKNHCDPSVGILPFDRGARPGGSCCNRWRASQSWKPA
jgi:heme exporter protein D